MAWTYQAGTSGTVTLPAGARLLGIRAGSRSAAGTELVIFGGAAIPLIAGTGAGAATTVAQWCFRNGPMVMAPASDRTIVFTGTVSYMVEYSTSPGT